MEGEQVKTGEEQTQTQETAKGAAPAAQATPQDNGIDVAGELKSRDKKISDMAAELATIKKRNADIDRGSREVQKPEKRRDGEFKEVLETAATDIEEAGRRFDTSMKQREDAIISEAEQRAIARIRAEAALTDIKAKIKTETGFTDDVVDVIIERADIMMREGMAQTAEEAITQAKSQVVGIFEDWAKKKYEQKPLPSGARMESGGNASPAPEKVERIPTAKEELDAQNARLWGKANLKG